MHTPRLAVPVLLIALVCVLLNAGCSRLRADNLAANSSYTLQLSGYLYPGQVIPGAGAAALRAGYADGPAWRGPSDVLTDGKRGGKAVQSWFWSNMDKRITAQFDLRRSARITHLAAWALTGSKTDFDRVEARVADTPSGLGQAPVVVLTRRDGGAVYDGAPLTGRYVELICQSGKAWMSLSEVEIGGEPLAAVAANAPPPGFAAPPARDLKRLAALPSRDTGDVDLAKRSGVRATLSASHTAEDGKVTEDPVAGDSQSLIQGKRAQSFRSFDGKYDDKILVADLDLGGTCRIDRIIIWSASRDSAKRSYFNGYRVSLKSSGGFWEPALDVDNPLLPGETLERGYPVSSPPIGKPARFVRIRLRCAPQSGDRIEIDGVEVWGRPSEAAPERTAALPKVKPLAASALASHGPISGDYSWILKDRVRAMYAMAGDEANDALLGHITQSGFNTLMMHTQGASHSAVGWPKLAAALAKVQKERGLHVIVSWPYGSDERYGNAQFGEYQPGGKARWTHTPCPLSEKYWNVVIGDRAVIAADAGLTGMVVDTEMYGADATRYSGPCYCDDCWGRFVKTQLQGSTAAAAVGLDDRPSWTAENDLKDDYAAWQSREVTGILQGVRTRVLASSPHFLLGNLLDLEAIPGLTAGLGTPERPALVFSESEYSGSLSGLSDRLATVRSKSLPALYISGLWVKPVTPPQLPDLILKSATIGSGYWIWSANAFTQGQYPHADGFTNDEYWKAFRDANTALDARLKH